MSLIHSFFPHLPLVSSFPSHLHVHETCKITRRQLFHVKKRAGEAQGILGVSEKNLKCYLLYSTSTWCGWMYFSPHWDVVAKIISKASGCPSVAMIPLHWGQLSLLFQGNLTQPCGKTWEICFTELMLSPAQCWAALGGIYVYALYAQGDIKGYTAFSGEKKITVVLNLSLNLELSVWIQPSGNHCKRLRLSLEHRCDLMIILLLIFKKKGSNLPFQNIIQSCLSAHFRKHRACYWSLSQNVGCLELAVLGNSSLHFQLLHLLLEDKQQYVKCFLNVCFY